MNRIVCSLALLCIAAVAPAALFGQSQANDAPDGRAIAILNRCSAVMGGNETISADLQGQVQELGTADLVPIEIKSLGTRAFREEVRRGSSDSVVVVVSDGRGSRKQGTHQKALSLQATAFHRNLQLPSLVCAVNPMSQGMTVAYEGESVVQGRVADVLKIWATPKGRNRVADSINALLSELHVFVDRETHVVLMTRSFAFSPDSVENRSPWEVVFSDYRRVDGSLVPFRAVHYVDGIKVREIQLSDATLKAPLSAADFQ